MTHIDFNLSALSSREARALSAMLSVLIAEDDGPNCPPTVQVVERPAPCPMLAIAGTVEVVDDPVQIAEQMADTVEEPAPAPVEKARRGRKAKEVQPDPPQAVSPLHAPAILATAASAPSGAIVPPTLDELREQANDYVQKHGMEAAVELLKDFGCARVNELAALALDDQLHFLELARG